MKVKKKEELTCLCLDGEMTIHNVAAFRDRLLEALGGSNRVEIDLQRVTAMDLAGLQILCAAHRTSQIQGKVLSLSSKQLPVLQQARCVAGFDLIHNCGINPAAECIWVGGMPE
ncbi:MAG TPA: hypothetical protein DDY20_01390 [Desulfobulbaceae bacterium]|nr:hypothetical protein [Desulfobulbaceae bacterium]